jgi:hypothetical protein
VEGEAARARDEVALRVRAGRVTLARFCCGLSTTTGASVVEPAPPGGALLVDCARLSAIQTLKASELTALKFTNFSRILLARPTNDSPMHTTIKTRATLGVSISPPQQLAH